MDLSLTAKEFGQFQSLVYKEAGIALGDQKQTLVVSRLSKRVRDLQLSSFQAYYDYIVKGKNDGELTNLLDLISTNKTDFFREPAHFQFLVEQVLPTLRSVRTVRIWSSASSSGEEPYTIAMTLYDAVDHPAQWDCKILASDISTKVLTKAAQGVYEVERTSTLPVGVLHRHFLRGTGAQSGYVKVKPHIRNMVTYRRMNLMDETFSIKSPLDVIFCRNVMIYFDRSTQAQLMTKFHRYLKPGGYLFIGHSESLQWIDHPFEYVAPTIYRKTIG